MRTTTPRDKILNAGLHLVMEWGENLLKPIQVRLGTHYPELSPADLDEINTICQSAMRFGHDYVYDLASISGKDTKSDSFERVMRERYPWIDRGNLTNLFSQGMYYAWKDMGFQ